MKQKNIEEAYELFREFCEEVEEKHFHFYRDNFETVNARHEELKSEYKKAKKEAEEIRWWEDREKTYHVEEGWIYKGFGEFKKFENVDVTGQKYKDIIEDTGYKKYCDGCRVLKNQFGDWEEMHKLTDEELRKLLKDEQKSFAYDLMTRVLYVTGEITDYKGLHIGRVSIEGTVIGKKGVAHVHSILAGGYNIQKLHVRVLVK